MTTRLKIGAIPLFAAAVIFFAAPVLAAGNVAIELDLKEIKEIGVQVKGLDTRIEYTIQEGASSNVYRLKPKGVDDKDLTIENVKVFATQLYGNYLAVEMTTPKLWGSALIKLPADPKKLVTNWDSVKADAILRGLTGFAPATAKPTVTPTATPTATSKPTATPKPTPVTPGNLATNTPTPTPKPTSTPTSAPAHISTLMPTPESTPTFTPTSSPIPESTPTLTLEPAVAPEPTLTPTPTPTATPTPTPTAKPTATPKPAPPRPTSVTFGNLVTNTPTPTPTQTPAPIPPARDNLLIINLAGIFGFLFLAFVSAVVLKYIKK